MKKEFVTYEIALSLKELGFSEPCLGFFDKELFLFCLVDQKSDCEINTITYKNGLNNIIADINYETIIIVPLYQQVTDWFREKHNIHIEVELTDNTMQFYYQYCIVDSKNREHHDEDMIDQATRIYNYNEKFHTFYEAREQAILKAIELCKKQ